MLEVAIALSVIALIITFLRPQWALYLFVLVESSTLVLVYAGVSSSLITRGGYALIIVGALGAAARRHRQQSQGPQVKPALVLYALAPGALVGFLSLPLGLEFAAIPLIATPLLGLYIGARIDQRARVILLRLLLTCVTANLAAGLLEMRSGAQALLSLGLKYGSGIRTIGEVLRAPGLTRFNVDAGLFGAAAAILFAYQLRHLPTPMRKPAAVLGLLESFALVFVTTSRSSLVLAAVGCFVVALSDSTRVRQPRHGGRGRRAVFAALQVLITVAAAAAFYVYGAGGSASLAERLGVWQTALAGGVPLFGHGMGSVGAATGTSVVTGVNQTFIDNYWLSIIYQFGVWAAVFIVSALVLALKRARANELSGRWRPAQRTAVRALILSLGAACLLVEAWEYTLAMVVVVQLVGLSSTSEPADESDSDAATAQRWREGAVT